MSCHRPMRQITSLITLLSQALAVTATCYKSGDNHANQSTIYTACNQNTPFSMCIRTQVDASGSPPDKRCLPNGLIVSDLGHYWRQGCTDPTWKSDYCLQALVVCPSDNNGNALVTSCSGYGNSSTWCCGSQNQACCGLAGALTLAATLGPTSTALTSSALSTTAPSSAVVRTTTAATPTATSTSDNAGLSTGAEAGIGVGASLAGLAILAGIIWLVLRSRKRRKNHTVGNGLDTSPQQKGDWQGQKPSTTVQPQPTHELNGSYLPSELLLQSQQPSELPTS